MSACTRTDCRIIPSFQSFVSRDIHIDNLGPVYKMGSAYPEFLGHLCVGRQNCERNHENFRSSTRIQKMYWMKPGVDWTMYWWRLLGCRYRLHKIIKTHFVFGKAWLRLIESRFSNHFISLNYNPGCSKYIAKSCVWYLSHILPAFIGRTRKLDSSSRMTGWQVQFRTYQRWTKWHQACKVAVEVKAKFKKYLTDTNSVNKTAYLFSEMNNLTLALWSAFMLVQDVRAIAERNPAVSCYSELAWAVTLNIW